MRLLLSILILLNALGCSYDEDPLSLITPDEFLLESRDAQSSVDAIYHYVHGGSGVYAKYYGIVQGLHADLGWYRGSNLDLNEFASFNVSPTNNILGELWTMLYQAIGAANFAIANIPATPSSDAEKSALITEARFLRAMFYFDLMRYFGGVPLIAVPFEMYGDNYFAPRSDLPALQQFIQDEFMFCLENLPNSGEPGRPIALSAAAFLAKFYLTTGDYNRAFQATRLLIRSERFQLVNDYAALFNNAVQNSPEDILSVYINDGDPATINVILLPPEANGRGAIRPTSLFLKSFDPADRRAQISLASVGEESYISKFWDSEADPTGGASPMDMHLIRFADVLLMHAEALNEIRNGSNTESLGAINLVRARARFDGSQNQDILPDLTRLSQADFREAILRERARELAWEGHRWFDLVRLGLLEEAVGAAKPGLQITNKHLLFPIPQKELDLNPGFGGQNPGY